MSRSQGLTPGWDPAKYLEFAGPRLRPALDLLARVPLAAPAHRLRPGLRGGERDAAPHRALAGGGGDGSRRLRLMLAAARAAAPAVTWVQADLGTWHAPRPRSPLLQRGAPLARRPPAALPAPGRRPRARRRPRRPDAAEPRRAVPHRDGRRRRGRALAGAPPPGAPRAAGRRARRLPRHPRPHVSRLDIWETEYLHALKATPSRRVDARLGAQAAPGRARGDGALGVPGRVRGRIPRAYPRRPDGRTLLPFRRLFIVAVR